MEVELIKLSKVEKRTNKGTVNIYMAVLKGLETTKSIKSGEIVAIAVKLIFECEGDESALDNYINQMIGDKRELILLPINKTLNDFDDNKSNDINIVTPE